MLSTRGQAYAESGLMAGYLRQKTAPFNKLSNPGGEIDFSNAENFLMHDDVVNYVNEHFIFDAKQCTYNEGPRGPKRLREAMASHINSNFSPYTLVNADQVTFTAGVTGLNEVIAFNLTDEGEGLLLGRPIYGSFYGDLKTKSKCELVYVSFGDIDQFSVSCVKFYEQALLDAKDEGIRVKALLICNPHNPLGRCYPVDTLKKIFALCEKHDIHLVSDEIYALSVFDVEGEQPPAFTSVLSIDPTGLIDAKKIHVLYGMAKDFGAAGLRLGCLVTQNVAMTNATQAISRFHSPSEVSSSIAATILEDKEYIEVYTKKSRTLLSEHYLVASKLLDQQEVNYTRGGNSGFFIWVDLSPYLAFREDDNKGWESEKILKEAIVKSGVPIASGMAYHAEKPGWFRILFTVEKDALVEAISRIIKSAIDHKRDEL